MVRDTLAFSLVVKTVAVTVAHRMCAFVRKRHGGHQVDRSVAIA
jgi:hypothetical protein